jgi:hypothetical protein
MCGYQEAARVSQFGISSVHGLLNKSKSVLRFPPKRNFECVPLFRSLIADLVNFTSGWRQVHPEVLNCSCPSAYNNIPFKKTSVEMLSQADRSVWQTGDIVPARIDVILISAQAICI